MKELWTKLGSKTVYENPWIRVVQDDVIRPDGGSGIYGVVHTKSGIGVVVVDEFDRAYLVAQYRYATSTYSLEIPKGAFNRFDGDETPLEAAKRELSEETGVTASKWEELATVHTLMGYSDDKVYLFMATQLSYGKSTLDEDEFLSVVTVPIQSIQDILRTGMTIGDTTYHMTDATSIAALLLALQRNRVG